MSGMLLVRMSLSLMLFLTLRRYLEMSRSIFGEAEAEEFERARFYLPKDPLNEFTFIREKFIISS